MTGHSKVSARVVRPADTTLRRAASTATFYAAMSQFPHSRASEYSDDDTRHSGAPTLDPSFPAPTSLVFTLCI